MLKMVTLTCTITRDDFSFKQITNYLNKIELTYLKWIKETPDLPEDLKEALSDKILELLNIIGEMSQPIFDKRSEIEISWTKKCSDPQAAKEGWIKEYTKLHKPYDRLKNQAYYLYCQINKISDDEA